MYYGAPAAPPPPAKPPVSVADVTISSILLVLTVIGGAFGGFMGLFMLAFTDSCPPENCNIDAAFTAIIAGLVIAVLIALIGTVVTIVRLIQRTRAWPFALVTLGLCMMSCVLGVVGYIIAVGG